MVDSRTETVTINIENIDRFWEVEENGKLMIVYFLPDEKDETKLV